MNDPCGLSLLAFVILIALVIYWRYFSAGSEDPDPILMDGRHDLGAIIEAGCIIEQRKSGRERGGDITLQVNHKFGQSFEADLNYRTLQAAARRGQIKLDSQDDR